MAQSSESIMGTVRPVVLFTLAWCLSAEAVAAQALTPVEERIVRHVDAHVEDAVGLLQRVVDINSGTMNHEGVRAVGQVFRAALDSLGFVTRWVDLPAEVNRAGHLVATRTGTSGKRVLLIGHLDTVFEEDSPFQRFARTGAAASGPGTEDMKGGDVVIVYALKALQAADALDGATITVVLTCDEEVSGSPLEVTRRPLIEAARASDVALGFEGGVGSMHTATVARRGFTGWTLRVEGERGHSSLIFTERYGAGAIYEAARILAAFYDEVRGEDYLTFGPGIILGGTTAAYDTSHTRGTAFGKTNVIPQVVTVAGDLRTLTVEQRERIKERMRAVVARHLPKTRGELTFRDSYPPMAPTDGNRDLLAALDRVSRDAGFAPVEAVDPGERGAADISFVAPYVDALDGLGVLGSGGHTPSEAVDLSSLPVATTRAALLIYRLTTGAGPRP